MINRRDMVVGIGGLVAAASAAALRPRNRKSLLGNQKLGTLIPLTFDGWAERPTESIVTPQDEDSLAAKLYSQIVSRLYNRGTNDVMMLIAYGDTQNDLLQLHRPEVCYPAFGFKITENRDVAIDVGNHVILPGRRLAANLRDRDEHILYWTRLGEFLPVTGSEQRMAKLSDQLAGIIPDGVLVRISNNIADADEAFRINQSFASSLIRTLPQSARPALMGTALAAQYAQASRQPRGPDRA